MKVARQPRVGIVSQGDEVVSPDVEPGPGQVRDINSYTLAGMVRHAGGIPLNYPIAPDRQEDLDALVRRALRRIGCSRRHGGQLGELSGSDGEQHQQAGRARRAGAWRLIRPGKPTILAVCDGKPVFGLPGNPVSCINIFRHFVEPTLRLMLGAQTIPAQTVAGAAGTQHPCGQRANRLRARYVLKSKMGNCVRSGVREVQSHLHAGALQRHRRGSAEQQRHSQRFLITVTLDR